MIKKERIWEIDAVRGIGIICVVIVHAFCYLEAFSSVSINWNPFFYFIKQYAGAFFVLVSGLSVSLGSNSVKRGIIVMICGFVLTALSVILFKTGAENEGVLIQWGVLHLIGFAMIVYPLYKKLPWQLIVLIAIAILAVGYYVTDNVYVESRYLFIFGLRYPWFYAWDWFPILPHLGWFMIGNVLGKIIYKDKKSLLPNWNSECAVFRFFRWCGRNSLQIYMIQMIGFYPLAKLF